jgi:uncharacterized protein YndB with AHSA1/START domain
MERRAEHTFPALPARLWQVFLQDEAFLQWAYPQMGLTLVSCEIDVEGEGDHLRVKRVLTLLPEREMPSFLKRLVKGTSQVVQTEQFDAAKGVLDFSVSVPVIGDRVTYGGHYTWEVTPAGETLRRWVGHCEARLPLIGKKVEAFFLGELFDGVEAMAPLLTQWISDHPEST